MSVALLRCRRAPVVRLGGRWAARDALLDFVLVVGRELQTTEESQGSVELLGLTR